MAQGHIFPKQQIEIVQVLEPKGYGTAGKELLPVMAKNLSLQEGDPGRGKSLKYTVFTQELQDHIKPLAVGSRFLCDIEERDRPESEYGPDRNIVQIYVDGKPVSQKKGGGGGGGYRGRSLEEDLILQGMKRRSIEGQTAVAQVGNILTCPTPIPGEDLGLDEESWKRILSKYWQAVERSLDNFLEQRKAVQGNPPKPDQRAQGNQEKAATPAAVPNDTKPPSDPIKHAGDLLTKAAKLRPSVSREELCDSLQINELSDIKNLEAAWRTAREISKMKLA